jgi:hypothetical protein
MTCASGIYLTLNSCMSSNEAHEITAQFTFEHAFNCYRSIQISLAKQQQNQQDWKLFSNVIYVYWYCWEPVTRNQSRRIDRFIMRNDVFSPCCSHNVCQLIDSQLNPDGCTWLARHWSCWTFSFMNSTVRLTYQPWVHSNKLKTVRLNLCRETRRRSFVR